ncbi:MAG: ABC-F family ATP-binding cassette domain-containing protein [Tissierellia bacterium]|nr:ABC-F family ATP-binding cassette domain-containing protein [Tissierellia bacterium]
MSILQVSNLNHSFGGREILKDVNFRLLNGEHVGLVGPNGEGKSSFLNIITGKLQPDVGTIEWAKRVRVGYLDQHTYLQEGMTIKDVLKDAFSYLFDIEKEIEDIYLQMSDVDEEKMNSLLETVGMLQDMLEHHDFYLIDSKIEEVSKAMGVDKFGLDNPVNDLSGGQRSKVLLCKLLLEKPDILLLDEPTNYLDEEHIEWLRRYLNEYENAFILISHDIGFLNSVINLIYHVENMELNRYVGDYNDFLRLHEEKQRQLEAAYNRQQQEISQLKDFVARNKARVATRNMAMSRQKKLDKMDLIELPREKAKPEFNFENKSAPGRLIFETKDLVIGYDRPLTRPLNLRMERGQRIAVIGENGLGKTTLIKTLLGLINPISGTIENGQNIELGYFEQEDTTDGTKTAIDDLWETFPSHTQASIRAMLAKCGLTTANMESQVMVLSGGERAKLRLCKIMNHPTNILILDEPTNHMDPEAKEELKRALREYKGGIFLISHERDFYEEIATTIWQMIDFK